MFLFSLVSFSLLLIVNPVFSKATNCAESQKLFADLCFTPTPTNQFELEWMKNNQPADGWHAELANDVFQLHAAELLKGKLLDKIDEDVKKNMCLRLKLEHVEVNETHARHDGEYFGFGDKYTNFTCDGSKDFFGVQKCKLNSAVSEYHEDLNVYFSYASNNNVHVAVLCYPNGQVGWISLAITNKLTDEEKSIVDEHVKSLGFPADTTVNIYNEDCNKN